jgi:hypothetical protein
VKVYSEEMESNISAKPADPELKRYLPSIPNGVTLQKPVRSKQKTARSSNSPTFNLRESTIKKCPLKNLETFKHF